MKSQQKGKPQDLGSNRKSETITVQDRGSRGIFSSRFNYLLSEKDGGVTLLTEQMGLRGGRSVVSRSKQQTLISGTATWILFQEQ